VAALAPAVVSALLSVGVGVGVVEVAPLSIRRRLRPL